MALGIQNVKFKFYQYLMRAVSPNLMPAKGYPLDGSTVPIVYVMYHGIK